MNLINGKERAQNNAACQFGCYVCCLGQNQMMQSVPLLLQFVHWVICSTAWAVPYYLFTHVHMHCFAWLQVTDCHGGICGEALMN